MIDEKFKRVDEYIKKKSMQQKIELLLKMEYEKGIFVPYDFNRLSDECRELLYKSIKRNFSKIYSGDQFKLEELGRIIGREKLSELSTKEHYLYYQDEVGLNYGNPYSNENSNLKKDTRNVFRNKSNRLDDYRKENYESEKQEKVVESELGKEIKELFENGRKDDAIYLIKEFKVIPTTNHTLSAEEYDLLLIELYSEQYKTEFLEAEFNVNPLLDMTISNELINNSPYFKVEDVLANNTESLEMQRNLLVQVIENLYITGTFHELVDGAEAKQEIFNMILSDDAKFSVVLRNGEQIDYKGAKDGLINRIKILDFSMANDRAELIKLSRHILNKYTKDIGDMERGIVKSLLNFDSPKEKENLDRIDETEPVKTFINVKKFFKKLLVVVSKFKSEDYWAEILQDVKTGMLEETGINEETIVKVSDKKVQKKIKERFIKKQLEKIQLQIKSNTNIKIKNSEEYRELIQTIVAARESKNKMFELMLEKENVILDNIDGIIEQSRYPWLEDLEKARDAYYGIKTSKENGNSPKVFSEMVAIYLDARNKVLLNMKKEGREFESERDAVNEIVKLIHNTSDINIVNNDLLIVYKSLEKVINEMQRHTFVASTDVVITNLGLFLDKKNQVYNIKHLNTMQLFKAKEQNSRINFARIDSETNNLAIDIFFDEELEVYGGHYREGDPEKELEKSVSVSDKTNTIINELFNSKFGKVYIPFNKLTPNQKEQFRKVYGYYVQLSKDEEFLPNASEKDEIEIFERAKRFFDKCKQMNENDRKAIEYQLKLGAGERIVDFTESRTKNIKLADGQTMDDFKKFLLKVVNEVIDMDLETREEFLKTAMKINGRTSSENRGDDTPGNR